MNGTPNGSARGKGPPPAHAQGQPKRPPHRLPDTIPKQTGKAYVLFIVSWPEYSELLIEL